MSSGHRCTKRLAAGQSGSGRDRKRFSQMVRMNKHCIVPARVALAVAAGAVVGNLYLIAIDALAPQSSAAARFEAPSTIQAARGRLPGEPRWRPDLQRWESP